MTGPGCRVALFNREVKINNVRVILRIDNGSHFNDRAGRQFLVNRVAWRYLSLQ